MASQRSDDLIFYFPAGIFWDLLKSVSSQSICGKFKENRSVSILVGPQKVCVIHFLKSKFLFLFHCRLGKVDGMGCWYILDVSAPALDLDWISSINWALGARSE